MFDTFEIHNYKFTIKYVKNIPYALTHMPAILRERISTEEYEHSNQSSPIKHNYWTILTDYVNVTTPLVIQPTYTIPEWFAFDDNQKFIHHFPTKTDTHSITSTIISYHNTQTSLYQIRICHCRKKVNKHAI